MIFQPVGQQAMMCKALMRSAFGRRLRLVLSGCVVSALISLAGCDNAGTGDKLRAEVPMLWRAGSEAPMDRQQWSVVNYWAVWCKPCVKEIPELNALAAEQPTLQVVGINYDQPPKEALIEQSLKLGIAFPLLLSHPDALGLPTPRVLPTSYIVNPAGEAVAVLTGPQTHASIAAALKDAGF